MPKQGLTEIAILVDRTGSMADIASDMEGGLNQFIKDQKAVDGECKVTLTQFDAISIDVIHNGVDINEVQPIKIVPRDMTPLLDAIGRTIVLLGERFTAMAEEDRPEKVLFVIVTDGQENASSEYTLEQIRRMIKEQQETYSWEFVYMGTKVDAFAESGRLGIAKGSTMSFNPNAGGVRGMSESLGASSTRYRTSRGGYQLTEEEQAAGSQS